MEIDKKETSNEVIKTDEELKKDAIELFYALALKLKADGSMDSEIIERLQKEGLDEESANVLVENINKPPDTHKHYSQAEGNKPSSNSKFIKWILIIIAILLINLFSYIFDWGFWFY